MSRKSVGEMMNQLMMKTQEAIVMSHRPDNLDNFDVALNELTRELNNSKRTARERIEIYCKMRKFQKMLRITETIIAPKVAEEKTAEAAQDGASTSSAPCKCCASGSH